MVLPVAAAALQAYRLVSGGATGAPSVGPASAAGGDFSATLSRAMASVVDTARGAEKGAMQAISGGDVNITDVVTAVAKAELALQTTVAVRDRVVQAYQDIMRMPI